MFGSPIVPVELAAAARRLRYRAAWVALPLVLLAGLAIDFLSATHDWWWDVRARQVLVQGVLPPQVLAASASRFFATFTYLQILAVLALTPAYVAGAIAQEKQRRNLDLLFVSALDSAEIVWGKFLVRVAPMAAVMAAGLPVLAITSLMGGIGFEQLAMSYGLAGALMVGLAGTCMVVSVFAERVWDAVLGTYVLAALVFFAAPAACAAIRTHYAAAAGLMEWLEPVLAANNPFRVLAGAAGGSAVREPAALVLGFVRNMTIWGVLTLAVSIWQLRPAYFRMLRAAERTVVHRQRRHELPPVGDRPMLWREWMAVESGMRGRMARWLMTVNVALLGLFLCAAGWYAVRAWVWPDGAAAATAKRFLSATLAGGSSAMAVVLLLAVSVRASISVAAERERGTLEPLLLSPLTGREIAAGKLFGAFWGVRWAIGPLAVSWCLGAAAGVIHPVGPLILLVDFAVFTLLSAAIGLHCSILARQPVMAVATTIGTWLLLCAGYLLFMIGPAQMSRLAILPLTPGFVYVLGQPETPVTAGGLAAAGDLASWILAELIWDACFLAIALYLFRTAARNFDVLIGRSVPRPIWRRPDEPSGSAGSSTTLHAAPFPGRGDATK